jgi:hypothetical protein
MKRNGAEVIHLATGMVVGYPPCPYINYFKRYIETKFNLKAAVGTHPVPEKYFLVRTLLKTWESQEWKELIKPTLKDQQTRLAYD